VFICLVAQQLPKRKKRIPLTLHCGIQYPCYFYTEFCIQRHNVVGNVDLLYCKSIACLTIHTTKTYQSQQAGFRSKYQHYDNKNGHKTRNTAYLPFPSQYVRPNSSCISCRKVKTHLKVEISALHYTLLAQAIVMNTLHRLA